MLHPRKATAALGAAALLATPLTLLAAAPANAAERNFWYAGAKIEFDVDKEGKRFDVDVDVDNAKPGSTWRITLWHDGKRYHKRIHTADGDGEIEIDKKRPNTPGKDVFKLRIKKIGGPKAVTRTITLR